ncbi:MAG: M42 family peptidase [Clostridiales bacterium]|nr:M42 family peptidase [Clostridiales bacterium]
MLEELKTLCALSGVSSREDQVRDYIRAQAEPYAASVRTDRLGNLIVEKRGARSAPGELLLAAHMDEVGMMIDRIHKDGTLGFQFVGGVNRQVVIGKKVYIGPNRVPAVVGMKPIHLTTAEERKKAPPTDKLYLDIGTDSREESEKLVELGDVAAFSNDIREFGDGRLKAKAIDDRVGCAVLLDLLRQDLPMDVTFVFTVQEEVGTRGALGAAFALQPKNVLVVEGTTAADLPGMEGGAHVCRVGGGPVLPFMDKGSIASRRLFLLLRRLAEENGIPWQTKEYIAGGTDGKAFQRSGVGARVAGLSAPVRYLHAPSSVVSIEDCRNMCRLARLFVDAMAQEV